MDKRCTPQVNINKCRLCLFEFHCYKDVYTEYTWMGNKEVYCEMLIETFNILMPVSQKGRQRATDLHLNPHEDPKRQIKMVCELCIIKLRDAHNFKKLILDSEDKLSSYVNNLKGNEPECDRKVTVKMEHIKSESVSDEENIFFDDFDGSDLKNEGNPEPIVKLEKSDIHLTLKKLRMKAGLTLRKLNSNSKTNSQKILRVRNKKPKGQGLPKISNTKLQKGLKEFPVRVLKKFTSIDNVVKILENSNITPFLWEIKRKYLCIFCTESFTEFKMLKEHTHSTHNLGEIKGAIMKNKELKFNKVDISYLQCKICSENCENLFTLKSHLTERHDIEFHNAEDILMPFKLNDSNVFPCQMCSETFHSFHLLNMHLNCHYFKHICDTCGAGFKSNSSLRSHVKRHTQVDRSKPKCYECDMTFENVYKKKKHDVAVHKKDPIHRCPYCPERFMEFSLRLKHQLQCHEGTIPSFRCDQCDKSFYRRYLLSRHIKGDHNLEYNFKCDVCDYKFTTKAKLKNHMIRHFGQKIHECRFCYKSYARAKTLKEHLKIHLNIRKWICNVCGEAFVQNVSLKNHMKKHL